MGGLPKIKEKEDISIFIQSGSFGTDTELTITTNQDNSELFTFAIGNVYILSGLPKGFNSFITIKFDIETETNEGEEVKLGWCCKRW